MRIDMPVMKTTILTFHQDTGITHDTRSISIVDADKEEIVGLIRDLFSEELERKDGEPINRSVKLTVQICDRTKGKQSKDEFSFRLFRCDVNVIERIVSRLSKEGGES